MRHSSEQHEKRKKKTAAPQDIKNVTSFNSSIPSLSPCLNKNKCVVFIVFFFKEGNITMLYKDERLQTRKKKRRRSLIHLENKIE